MRRDKTRWRLREVILSYSLLVGFIIVFQRSVFQALRGGEENNNFYTIVDAKTENEKAVTRSSEILLPTHTRAEIPPDCQERFDSPMHSPTQNYKQCLVAARESFLFSL